MKRRILYVTICIACCFNYALKAQNVTQYKKMYETIIDSLHIDKAYVSDSLWEFEYNMLRLCNIISYDSCLRLETRHFEEKLSRGNHSGDPYKYLEREAEYSDLLHSNFATIATSINSRDDLGCLSTHEPDIIFFSSSYRSYVCADVYVHVSTRCGFTLQDGVPQDIPQWGNRLDWYKFIFEVQEDAVSLLGYFQVQGL